MPSKLPWMKFYPADWMLGTRSLSLAARGGLIDLICILWNCPTRGSKTLDLEGWSWELGRSLEETTQIFLELEKKQNLKMKRESNGDVTISCKRQLREEKARKATRLRVEKFRSDDGNALGNEDVQDCNRNVRGRRQKTEVRSQKSDQEKESVKEKEIPLALRAPGSASFLEKLKANPAYKHIDIDHELAKMDAWLSLPANRQRKKTDRFVLNWLNKIDKPVTTPTTVRRAWLPGTKSVAQLEAEAAERERNAPPAKPLTEAQLARLPPIIRERLKRDMSNDPKKPMALVVVS